jgi:organic hydroperoxide reductase OsmC/OhrA
LQDLAIRLPHEPGALARMGEVLGAAGVSVEGGGGFVVDGQAVMHFLFEEGARARTALEAAGIEVMEVRDVLVQKLDQGTPGQLGRIARRMADAGVNIEVVYSDHQNQLVLGVDRLENGKAVLEAWTKERESRPAHEHRYETHVRWTGNTGDGTRSYRGYERAHEIDAPGKPVIPGSSDPKFRGDRTRWNPEELLVAALSTCHQLWYLHLCADSGVVVTAYEDRALGVMNERGDGGGRFTRVLLRPRVTIAAGSDRDVAMSLHERAHALCFIASSVNFPVQHEAEVIVAPAD